MSYLPHLRVVFSGSLWGTDRWTTGCQISTPGNDPPALPEGQAALEGISAWMETIFDDGGSGILNAGSQTVYDRAQMYFVNSAGVALFQWEYAPSPPVAGGGTPLHPPQVAVVASLRTGLPGRNRRGRMYLPCLGVAIGGGGLIPTATAGGIAEAAAELLTGINTVVAGEFGAESRVVVASNTGIGLLTPVTSVQVGNVFDTQRRRRSDFTETWQTSPVAVP